MIEYPDNVCGAHLTDQVVFVCWRDRYHDGPHLSFLHAIDLHQVHGLLIDSDGRKVEPHPDDMTLVETHMGRFLEYVSG